MVATRYEGIYYKINRHGKKTFIERFKIDGKSYKRVIGNEPQINAQTATFKEYF